MSADSRRKANREIWEAVTAAWAAGDTATLSRLIDSDMTIVEPDCLPYRGVFRGPQGYAEVFRRITAAWDDLSIERGELVGGGEGESLAIEYFTSATARATGKRIEREPSLALWKFRDGKVVSMTPFNFDTVVLKTALSPE